MSISSATGPHLHTVLRHYLDLRLRTCIGLSLCVPLALLLNPSIADERSSAPPPQGVTNQWRPILADSMSSKQGLEEVEATPRLHGPGGDPTPESPNVITVQRSALEREELQLDTKARQAFLASDVLQAIRYLAAEAPQRNPDHPGYRVLFLSADRVMRKLAAMLNERSVIDYLRNVGQWEYIGPLPPLRLKLDSTATAYAYLDADDSVTLSVGTLESIFAGAILEEYHLGQVARTLRLNNADKVIRCGPNSSLTITRDGKVVVQLPQPQTELAVHMSQITYGLAGIGKALRYCASGYDEFAALLHAERIKWSRQDLLLRFVRLANAMEEGTSVVDSATFFAYQPSATPTHLGVAAYRWADRVALSYVGAVEFLVAHELGHQTMAHREKLSKAPEKDDCRLRQDLEFEADLFSFLLLTKLTESNFYQEKDVSTENDPDTAFRTFFSYTYDLAAFKNSSQQCPHPSAAERLKRLGSLYANLTQTFFRNDRHLDEDTLKQDVARQRAERRRWLSNTKLKEMGK